MNPLEILLQAGVLRTAIGSLRQSALASVVQRTGTPAARAVARVRELRVDGQPVTYDTARALVRRAITAVNSANRLNEGSGRLRVNQHALDPYFLRFTTARFVYRTVLVCTDEATGKTERIPVDVEAEDSLSYAEIRDRALTAFAKGQRVITSTRREYKTEGSCFAIDVIVTAALRTR
jgi:hypothetical protein